MRKAKICQLSSIPKSLPFKTLDDYSPCTYILYGNILTINLIGGYMSFVLRKKHYHARETNEVGTILITSDRCEFAFRIDAGERPTTEITFGLRIWNKLKRMVVVHTKNHESWVSIGDLTFMVYGGEDRIFIEMRQTGTCARTVSLNLPREVWDQMISQSVLSFSTS